MQKRNFQHGQDSYGGKSLCKLTDHILIDLLSLDLCGFKKKWDIFSFLGQYGEIERASGWNAGKMEALVPVLSLSDSVHDFGKIFSSFPYW